MSTGSVGSIGARVLLVVEDAVRQRWLASTLRSLGYDVVVVGDGPSAVRAVREQCPSVVLLDLQSTTLGGAAALPRLQASAPMVPVLSLGNDNGLLVPPTSNGIYGTVPWPIEPAQLMHIITGATTKPTLVAVPMARRRVRASEYAIGLERTPVPTTRAQALTIRMGSSAKVMAVIDHVFRVAPTRLTTLILGETGVGKELVAQAVHGNSARSDGPMVAVDCGAIPDNLLESELFGFERGAFSGADRRKEGRFEQANGGTIFLDEIGNLSPNTQAKLLRVLEEHTLQRLGGVDTIHVDIRVIAATHEDLPRRVESGLFRADLYYRLAEYIIQVPALRSRREDIPYLVARLTAEAAHEFHRDAPQWASEALTALTDHPWHGNVRELRNVVRQAVLHGKRQLTMVELAPLLQIPGQPQAEIAVAPATTAKSLLPASDKLRPITSLKEIADGAADEAVREAIIDALTRSRGNKSQAARMLQVDFKTLQAKMRRLGVVANRGDDDSDEESDPNQ